MSEVKYPPETLGEDEDNGTMVENVEALAASVVGHRIVSAEKSDKLSGGTYSWSNSTGLVLTLDDGRKVALADDGDCCAFTELRSFLLHPERVDHVITGVGTTDGYTRWHIYADLGDVLEMTVAWSAGNPFYYGYGFNIYVIPADETVSS